MEEFSKEVPGVEKMRLFNGNGVFVIWKWQWDHGPVTTTSEEVTTVDESFCGNDEDNVQEGDGDEQSNEEEDDRATKPHTVVFKCIGATRDDSYQVALKAARDQMEGG